MHSLDKKSKLLKHVYGLWIFTAPKMRGRDFLKISTRVQAFYNYDLNSIIILFRPTLCLHTANCQQHKNDDEIRNTFTC